MKNLKLLSVVLFVAVALIVPSCLYASTLTYETGPVTIPSTTTDWTQNLQFQQFNPLDGTLDSVVLTLGGSLTTTITLTNISGFLGSPADSSGAVATQSVISVQDSASDLTNPMSQLAITSPPQPYALPGSPNGSTQVFPEPETPLSDSFTYLAPAVLSGFHRLRADSVGSFDIDWDRVPQSQYRRCNLFLAGQQRCFDRDHHIHLHSLGPRTIGAGTCWRWFRRIDGICVAKRAA